jgi:hypothetical protein
MKTDEPYDLIPDHLDGYREGFKAEMHTHSGKIMEGGLAKALTRRPHLACCLRIISKSFSRMLEAEDGGFLNVAPASSVAAVDELRRELEMAEALDEEAVQSKARHAQDALELAILKQNRARREALKALKEQGAAAGFHHQQQHLADLAQRAGRKVTKRMGSFIEHSLHQHHHPDSTSTAAAGAEPVGAPDEDDFDIHEDNAEHHDDGDDDSAVDHALVHKTAEERRKATELLAASTQRVIEMAEAQARKSLAGPLHVGHNAEVRRERDEEVNGDTTQQVFGVLALLFR